MNKIVQEQLKKCRLANIPEWDENTSEILIKRQTTLFTPIAQAGEEFILNHYYLIEVEDYIIHPYPGFTLHTNWNQGRVPTDKQMKVEITQKMGKMLKVEAVGNNDGKSWAGWLPFKSCKNLGELV